MRAGDGRDLGQAEQDAVPERVDERRGDVVWDCGQALGAGDVRGVDRPCRAWVTWTGQCASG